jgi:hypothetical protein
MPGGLVFREGRPRLGRVRAGLHAMGACFPYDYQFEGDEKLMGLSAGKFGRRVHLDYLQR